MASKNGRSYTKTILAVALALGISAGAAELIVPYIADHEGLRLVGYFDIVNVPTKCFGDTYDVIVGKRYSMDECLESLATQIIDHVKPVLQCTPVLKDHPYQLTAASSLAYNIGGPAYCRSSVARRFNEGQWRAACEAILLYDKAGGKTAKGLTKRRTDEYTLCLTNIPEAYQ